MSFGPRTRRYGPPAALVVLGLAWAALDTGRVGNTAGTALIAAGLILFMVLLGRELGMGERGGRAPVPPRGPGSDEPTGSSASWSAAAEPNGSAEPSGDA